MPETQSAGPSSTPVPEIEKAPTVRVSSPRGQAAAALVGALAKAARAFTLYDAGNSLVRQFIGEYRAKAESATAGGDVILDIRPFELGLGPEVVYKEEDRERSLAFKLFRDGVRKLTFGRGVTVGELLRLLQILAVRFVGVRQAEDDVVTLLRKAEFRTITFVAVEGYTSEDDDAAPDRSRRGGELPPDYDTPFPRLRPPGPIACAPIPDEALAALRGEEAPEALGQSGLRLASELAAWARRGAITPAEVARFCGELRDFLIADRQLGILAGLADLAHRQPAGELRDEMLRGLADARLLDAVLAGLPESGGEFSEEAARLVPFVPAAAVLDRIGAEESPGRRATLLGLVEARMPADAGEVAARLPDLPVEVARALLGLLARMSPEHAHQASLALLAHADPGLQLESVRALAGSAQRVPAEPLVKLLASPREQVRIAAAQALERHGDARAAKALADALAGGKADSRDEAAALGRSLGVLNASAALRLFEGWLVHKKKLFGSLRVSEQEELLRWAAVAGLGAIPGPDAERQLEVVSGWADEALRRHVHGTVARRRAEGRRRG